jgi:CubicO group peptidase (beta-lactamase class C family)
MPPVHHASRLALTALVLFLGACGGDDAMVDVGLPDARIDADAAGDTGGPDTSTPDATVTDSGPADGAPPDAAVPRTAFPGATWETRTPDEVGMDEAAIDDFVSRIGGDGCLVKDGYMVRTWGDPASKADWASASKPVTATMLFFAIEEGRLSGVDALVGDFGWALTAADSTMTFRHLADMTSGYSRGEAPGEAWAYNDYAINLYKKTMFDRVFDDGSADAAARQPTRLGALGFEDGAIYGTRGGYGVSTSCRDFARIGLLWLNRGYWDGEQLLPQHYFDDYMQPDVPGDLPRTTTDGSDYLGVGSLGGGNDQSEYGPGIYGFNWWFNAPVGTTSNLTWPDAPADTFQANGHFDREIVTVIPSLGLVVAARGSWGEFAPGDASAGMDDNLALLASTVR